MMPAAYVRDKLRVVATDIAPGDFTTFTGFRRAVDVTLIYETTGRGKKRVERLVSVVIDRAAALPDTLDTNLLDKQTGEPKLYTIYRPRKDDAA